MIAEIEERTEVSLIGMYNSPERKPELLQHITIPAHNLVGMLDKKDVDQSTRCEKRSKRHSKFAIGLLYQHKRDTNQSPQ